MSQATQGSPLRVQVLYFAALRERVGREQEELELAAGATVMDLVAALEARHESLRGLRGYRVAVNHAFARDQDPVPEGAEVALIPPVAGGAPEAPDERPRVRTHLTRDPISADALWAEVGDPGAGGVAVFLGVVRDHHAGRSVAHLEYQAYEAMAGKELERVAADLVAAHPDVRAVSMVHRFGDLDIGEASVGIAVSTAHRAESFAACRWAIDEIKERVPIWKREHYRDGDPVWVRADEMGQAEGEPSEAPPLTESHQS